VRGIGVASFLSDVGHEVPTSLLPSLLTSTLGAPASALGLIEGVSDGLAGVARVGGGALADDPSRRRAVAVGGYTTTAVLSSTIGAASSVWQVGLLRAGAWTARGLRVPSRNALLADVVHPSAYGRAYGFERAMDNLGAIFGPLLAIGLVAWVGTRTAIALSIVPGLLAAVAIVYAIRHTPRPSRIERAPIRLRVRPVLATPGARWLFGGITAFELGNVAATLLILRATELLEPVHGQDRAVTLALVLYLLYNVAATLASPLGGRLSDRRSPRLALGLGALAFAVSYAGFGFDSGSWMALVPWFVAAGIGIGLAETAQHAAVATTAPEPVRGSAFGLLAGIQSLGNVVASGAAGLLWTLAGPAWAFVVLAGAMSIATVVLWRAPAGVGLPAEPAP
jgi:MFS family permease